MVPDLRRMRSYPWHILVPVLAFVALTLAGVTQSSIGIDLLRADPAAPAGVMLGDPLTIRSDEFLTSTPNDIGVTASGTTDSLNPLSESSAFFAQLPAGPVSNVVLVDGWVLKLGSVLPDQMLIASRWWGSFLLLVLAAPVFFRTLTGSTKIGYFAAALIIFSPASAWWSYSQVDLMGFTLAGAAALQLSAKNLVAGRRWRAVAWGVSSALLLARTPLFYQPWAIIVVSAVILATVAGLLVERENRRERIIAVVGTGVLTVILLGAVIVENLSAIQATLNTVYPGARVSTGGLVGLQEIFGATNLGRLGDYATITGSSQSEISSSYAVVAVWAVILLAHRLSYRVPGHRAAVWVMSAACAFWFAWSTIDFGTPGSHVPLLNMVPAGRAADIIGYLAILLLCLCLPALADRNGVGFSLLAAVVTAGVAAHAGSLIHAENIPEMSIRWIWLCAALLALVVFMITYRPRHTLGYVAAGVLAFSLVWNVNPVLFGLGDLRGTPVADAMLEAGQEARADGTLWASDTYTVDSLFASTGVPALSGRQIAGPDAEEWRKLDPTGASEEAWNRGGTFIWMVWTDEESLTISNPNPDIIQVQGSPCVFAKHIPELKHIVSTHELDLTCVEEEGSFEWGKGTRWVYSIDS